MKVYKGTDKNLQCRGFQYEIGKEYVEDNADLCHAGFHGCERPLDVFVYYYPASSRYFEAELDDVSDQRESDSKVCGRRIKIGAEIGIPDLIEAQIEYVNTHATSGHTDPKAANAGDYGAATSRGSSSVGKSGIAISRGNGVKAKGALGAILLIAEENDDNFEIKNWSAAVVDGNTIKANTWYTIKNGVFTEIEED